MDLLSQKKIKRVCKIQNNYYKIKDMRILLIGNGAREHVIAENLKTDVKKLFAFMSAKNPGITNLSDDFEIGSLADFDKILSFAKRCLVDYVIIGPENPIVDGLGDLLSNAGIKVFAPKKSLARIEGSKSFARNLLLKYEINALPKFKVFDKQAKKNEIENYVKEFEEDCVVVKYDSLAGGKGVKVGGEHLFGIDEAVDYAIDCLTKSDNVVVEEKLIGEEFSLMSICDGDTILHTPAIQDHKRAHEGDNGPQTGGMGSISFNNFSLPFLSKKDTEDAQKINYEVMKAIEKETGIKYCGVLYGGFIATANGIKVIEYNARFGDPEAMNVFPILKTSFAEVIKASTNNDLKSISKLEFENKSTVCKYLVPNGYPENPQTDKEIKIDNNIDDNAKIYLASVYEKNGKIFSGSSRSIAVVGIHEDFEKAGKIANETLLKIKGDLFFRKDIGSKKLVQKRIDNMSDIRK